MTPLIRKGGSGREGGREWMRVEERGGGRERGGGEMEAEVDEREDGRARWI